MKIPPVNHSDLVALGLDANARIESSGIAISVTPPPPWVVARILSAAILSPPPEEPSAYCRHVRNLALTATDWTQAADSPLTEEQRAAWAAYRQALRDLPQVYSGDGPIPWPVAP